MNITLNHKDIIEAISDYVQNQGIKIGNKTMEINITCGRGANNTSATVDLIDADSIAAGPEKETVVPGTGNTKKTSTKNNKDTAKVASDNNEYKDADNNESTNSDGDADIGLFDN